MPSRRRPPSRDLFEGIASFSALIAATRRAAKGKRRSPCVAAFLARAEPACLALERSLRDGSWRPGRYTVIELKDPKPRRISAAPFRDRVVHHAVCAVVEPLFERGFVSTSYANRVGYGAHRAVETYERFRDSADNVLRCDVYRYFPAIDHAVLKADLRRRIACERTLWLLDAIVDGSNAQEPVHLHYPGDDLLTPVSRRRGLPIGNLTSQFFANVVLDPLDHFVKERLGCRRYLRYVDDFALFHDSKAQLEDWRRSIETFLAKRRLSLHPSKTRIAEAAEPTVFLGYELHADGRRRLTAENVRRFCNKLRGLRDRWRVGAIGAAAIEARVQAWIAHAAFADTLGLRSDLFPRGWFDPFSRGQPVRRRSHANGRGRGI